MSSEPKAVAWQYRFNTQEGWGSWYDCQEHQLYLFEGATDSEVRPLYDEQALSALRAEVEALRLDAGRYRWLRDKSPDTWEVSVQIVDGVSECCLASQSLDESIDAAMEQSA